MDPMQIRISPELEQVPLWGTGSVAVREFRLPAFVRPWHQHPEIELTWIVKGNGLRYVGDSVEAFHAGDFCLLGRDLPHTWLSPVGMAGSVRSLVVQFDPSRWGEEMMGLPEMAKIVALFEKSSRGLQFDAGMGERLRKPLLARKSPLQKFTALLETLQELAQCQDVRPLSLAPWKRNRRLSTDPRLQTVLEFLARRSSEPISQREAAELVRLSPAAFSRFFRRAVGKTFGAYLSDLRLSDASRRLLETDESISQIAFASGFGNLSTFNRAFRKARGISPRAFRKQIL